MNDRFDVFPGNIELNAGHSKIFANEVCSKKSGNMKRNVNSLGIWLL